jgi:hypothetical protein
VAFDVLAGNSTAADLVTGDKMALIYRFKDAQSRLATPGQTIDMSVDLKTDGLEILVNPARTTTIASSKQAVTVALTSEPLGTVRVATAEEGKKFSGENPAGGTGAYVSDSEAILGYFELTDQTGATTSAKTSNGYEDWKIGYYTDTKVNTDTTLLTIADGQFAASKTAPGDVLLFGTGTAQTLGSESADSTTLTDTDASWKLSDDLLKKIAADTASANADVNIRLKLDGNTEVNMPENSPTIGLHIDYNEDWVADYDVDPLVILRKFRSDGASCILYNIPNSVSAPDTVTVRITNPTNSEGLLKAQMWGQDGSELIPAGTMLNDGNNIKPYETVVVPVTALEDLAGGAWDARGVLKVTSTVPKLEMFGMLRDKATGIVTNLSAGATGSGCTF